MYMKRDLCIGKETYVQEKRPMYRKGEEIYVYENVYEKKPI